MIEQVVVPAGPYSLAACARGAGDATRVFREGRLDAALLPWDAAEGRRGAAPGARPELASARQRPDGALVLRAATTGGIAALRFQLALADDPSPFFARWTHDPLLGPSLRELRALRPIRVGSVAQALLRALCGQLVLASQARAIERAVMRAATPRLGETVAGDGTTVRLHAPPTGAQLARLAPAELRRLGLHARRGAALVRICAGLEPERLHEVETAAVDARLARERGLGPWSVGVVCMEGLGRRERGIVGDLGLVRLLGQLLGRRVEGHETAALLERYGDDAGLAGFYLLAGMERGLVPTASGLPDAVRAA